MTEAEGITATTSFVFDEPFDKVTAMVFICVAAILVGVAFVVVLFQVIKILKNKCKTAGGPAANTAAAKTETKRDVMDRQDTAATLTSEKEATSSTASSSSLSQLGSSSRCPVISSDIKEEQSVDKNPVTAFQLPFHTDLFEGVPFVNRVAFTLWVLTVGPLFMILRVLFCMLVCLLCGPSAVVSSLSVLVGWIVWIEGDNLPSDTRSIVFLSNHHVSSRKNHLAYAVLKPFGPTKNSHSPLVSYAFRLPMTWASSHMPHVITMG